jgi:hypothetical protein
MTPSHYALRIEHSTGAACSFRGEEGFVLPMSVLLVLILTISGTGFMQHDYLERRMTMNEVDNHGAFFLANAGIERARGAFKIPFINGAPTWTPVLEDPALTDPAPNALCPAAEPTCLCPDLSRGCVIPPFGALVTPANDIPFDETFDEGEYAVRAFNNEENPAACPGPKTTDCDQILTFRALGRVRGEEKLLEVRILAISGLKLINCNEEGEGLACPESESENAQINHSDGREPAQFPAETIPAYDPTFYSDPSNFPALTPRPYSGTIEDNSYYAITGDATVQEASGNNVVIFSTGNVTVTSDVQLTNAIIVGQGTVSMDHDVTIHAPRPYPTVIAEGTIHASDGVQVHGTVYSSTGDLDLRPISVHGLLIGRDVRLREEGGEDPLATDDGSFAYYAFMPGFTYPREMTMTMVFPGTWREL